MLASDKILIKSMGFCPGLMAVQEQSGEVVTEMKFVEAACSSVALAGEKAKLQAAPCCATAND